jgi:hypothetical protein
MDIRLATITAISAVTLGACSIALPTSQITTSTIPTAMPTSAPATPAPLDPDDLRCLKSIRAYQATMSAEPKSIVSLQREKMLSDCQTGSSDRTPQASSADDTRVADEISGRRVW